MRVTCDLPIKAESPLNSGRDARHWAIRAKRRKMERSCVALWFASVEARPLRSGRRVQAVTFTRFAPSRGLDSDSLPASCKSIRDEVAKQLGVDDGPKGPVQWCYDQARALVPGLYFVRIDFDLADD